MAICGIHKTAETPAQIRECYARRNLARSMDAATDALEAASSLLGISEGTARRQLGMSPIRSPFLDQTCNCSNPFCQV